MPKLSVRTSAKYRREYAKLLLRRYPMKLLDDVVDRLADGEQLPPKFCVHPLQGEWLGHFDCHIRGDWILVYRYVPGGIVLELCRTGTHSDIFGN